MMRIAELPVAASRSDDRRETARFQDDEWESAGSTGALEIF
jgi:hypothetical protein